MTLCRTTVRLLGIAVAFVGTFGMPTAASEEVGFIAAGCSGTIGSGETGTCTMSFRSTDSVYWDSHSTYARLTSVVAAGWKVEGLITDGVGDPYFTWSCSAGASAFSPTGQGGIVISSCRTSEFLRPHGNSPPHPGTHTVTVTATADFCGEGGLGLCPYAAKVNVRPGAAE